MPPKNGNLLIRNRLFCTQQFGCRRISRKGNHTTQCFFKTKPHLQSNDSSLTKTCQYNSLGIDTVQQLLLNGIDSKRIILDRKSTRLNSSHVRISYAVFCLKKKKKKKMKKD